MDITLNKKKITLLNIYGPNNDNPSFFLNILKTIEEFQNDEYIICGDFNLVLNQDLDTKNYLHINHPKAREKFIEHIEGFDLKDPFRELYPTLRRYTWRKTNPVKLARLYLILISNNLMPYVENVLIDNSYRSDHSGVILFLKLNTIQKGKGLWKFNNSLLTDKEYLKIIKAVIDKTIAQYAILIYKVDNLKLVPKSEIQFVINEQLFLETLLMEIRGKTISYSAYKKKK